MSTRSTHPITVELPRLMSERSLSLRSVARDSGVDPTHLSRALRGAQDKRFTGELAGRVAEALGLPVDYFPEYRESLAVKAIRADPTLRDEVYDRLG